ncbi:hypothetical protein TNCV_3632311 [Trichonephila clavipes]|nr:hypothetical protein TNCV_3632311 [Trichonephila clavipes]
MLRQPTPKNHTTALSTGIKANPSRLRDRCSGQRVKLISALGVEDVRAPLALSDPRKDSRIRLSPADLGPSGPLDSQLINLHCL